MFVSQSLTCLHLQIKCREELLVHMLGLVPTLEELWMGLSSPRALSSTFFLAFAAGGCNASAMIGTSNQTIPSLCRELKRLHLHYKRWLRGPERNALMPAFGAVVASHQRLTQTDFSLCLSFNEGSKEQVWEVSGLVEEFDIQLGDFATYIGFPGPRGIVSLSTPLPHDHAYFQHFRELEYIVSEECSRPPVDYLLPFHSLKEVRIPGLTLEFQPNKPLCTNFPFFRTIEVLDVGSIQSSLIAGQTFHKLEKFGETTKCFESNTGRLVEMPVCTKLVVELSRLASLKLPQIRELGVYIHDKVNGKEPNGEKYNVAWEKHVAVNSNLSGLKLLHFYDLFFGKHLLTGTNLFQILKSLPALETLIVDDGYIDILYMDFFKAFVPIRVQETAGLQQSSGEGQMSGVLCPKLESLQIQGVWLTVQSELMPVLKEIVSLRTAIGFPLKSFTFYFSDIGDRAQEYSKQKWELIGKDGRFVTEAIAAQRFELDI